MILHPLTVLISLLIIANTVYIWDNGDLSLTFDSNDDWVKFQPFFFESNTIYGCKCVLVCGDRQDLLILWTLLVHIELLLIINLATTPIFEWASTFWILFGYGVSGHVCDNTLVHNDDESNEYIEVFLVNGRFTDVAHLIFCKYSVAQLDNKGQKTFSCTRSIYLCHNYTQRWSLSLYTIGNAHQKNDILGVKTIKFEFF